MQWSYGVTTVPLRHLDLLPRTLKSLAAGGFDQPRLFIDGAKDDLDYRQHGLPTTCHFPALNVASNWILSMYELYLRDANADRFALFQDDVIVSKNLRRYLEKCPYPEKGYWNLYTVPENERVRGAQRGWYESNQRGKGALALVFNREAVLNLLCNGNEYMAARAQDTQRGFKFVDGGIVCALRNRQYKEYVHLPSLVQHTGLVSVVTPGAVRKHPRSFRGEDFDCLTLLEEARNVSQPRRVPDDQGVQGVPPPRSNLPVRPW